MNLHKALLLIFILMGTVATAEGNPVSGKAIFEQRCTNCHIVRAPSGELLAGRIGRSGPNLYGVMSRKAASAPDFRYSSALTRAAEDAGLVWDTDTLTQFIENPTGYLRTILDDNRARSRMVVRLDDADAVQDIVAFLTTATD